MNTTDTNKFLRWSISGWIAILSGILFVVLDIISSLDNQPKIFPSLASFVGVLGSDSLANIFVIALAGFPLGFLIYQFYFFIRWNSPFSENGLWPPFILGRKYELEMVIKDIEIDNLNFSNSKWRKDWVNNENFNNHHGYKWQYIESLLTEAFQKIDTTFNGDSLHERYRYLVEMSHILGASLGGVYVGFLGYWIIKIRTEMLPLNSYAIFFVILTAILLVLLESEDGYKQRILHSREDKSVSLSSQKNNVDELETKDQVDKVIKTGTKEDEQADNLRRKKDKEEHSRAVLWFRLLKKEIHVNQPSTLFVIVIGMIIFFASTAILDNKDFPFALNYYWRITLVLPSVLILHKWSGTKEEKRGAGVILFLGLLISLLIRHWQDVFLQNIDWPFVSAVFIFLVLNLVLIKNRQNARDDLIAFENYTLKRFLNDENCCRKG